MPMIALNDFFIYEMTESKGYYFMHGISRNYRIPEELLGKYEAWCLRHGVQVTDGPVFAIWLMMGITDSNEVAELKTAFYEKRPLKPKF